MKNSLLANSGTFTEMFGVHRPLSNKPKLKKEEEKEECIQLGD